MNPHVETPASDPAAHTTAWRDHLDAAVESFAERMQRVREHLHAHPELSGFEYATTNYLREQIDESRFAVRPGPDGRGLIVDTATVSGTPIIALRADIDALPIQDAKDVSYRSRTPNVMHACGHDAHAAGVLGAMWAIDAAAQAGALPFPVPFRAVFQPAEETNEGALDMIAEGCLENAGGIIGAHMDPRHAPGTVSVRQGALTADCVELRIRIVGRAGHGARPHESLDPIAAAAQLITVLHGSVHRGSDSHEPIVLSFGAIHAGDAPNAIPDELFLRGTLRTLGPDPRDRAKEHILHIANGIASATGARIDVQYIDGPPAMVNDSELSAILTHEAISALGESKVYHIDRSSMGGEDFANYTHHVPGAMFRAGCAMTDDLEPLHSPRFDVAPEALTATAKVLARAAAAWTQHKTRSSHAE
jgi:amidohydrolase